MTVNMPSSMVELKLDRLIDDMRFLKSHTIAFDTRLRGIKVYLKPSERQPESKSAPWLAAAVARRQGQFCLQNNDDRLVGAVAVKARAFGAPLCGIGA